MSIYRILSVDGGGVRGVLAARILDRLERALPGIIDKADLLAGTSTGSIIAVGLAKGLSPATLATLYQENSSQIFHQSLLHDLGDLWGFIGAKYSAKNRWLGLYPTFGQTTLGQLSKKVLVAAFDLGGRPDTHGVHQWQARFFHNFEGPTSAANEQAMDVIMRSSAAPTYFPIYQNFIDGGVVAKDYLGSIREMTNGTGTIVWQQSFDPYGVPTTIISTTPPDCGFTGLYAHSRSGLNMAEFRNYSPSLGRWLNRDPLGELAGLFNVTSMAGHANANGSVSTAIQPMLMGGVSMTSHGMQQRLRGLAPKSGSNLYGYVHNNPLSFKDPSGLQGCAPDPCQQDPSLCDNGGGGNPPFIIGGNGGNNDPGSNDPWDDPDFWQMLAWILLLAAVVMMAGGAAIAIAMALGFSTAVFGMSAAVGAAFLVQLILEFTGSALGAWMLGRLILQGKWDLFGS